MHKCTQRQGKSFTGQCIISCVTEDDGVPSFAYRQIRYEEEAPRGARSSKESITGNEHGKGDERHLPGRVVGSLFKSVPLRRIEIRLGVNHRSAGERGFFISHAAVIKFTSHQRPLRFPTV
jgi:hypothetical protein